MELNITTERQPLRTKPEFVETSAKSSPFRTPIRTPKKRPNSGSNGFTFEFGGGGQKVKAIVARKRPIGKAITEAPIEKSTESPTAKSSVALRRKSMGALPETTKKVADTAPKSVALRRKSLGATLREPNVKAHAKPNPFMKTTPTATAEQKSFVKPSPKSETNIISAPLRESNVATPTKSNPFMQPQKTPKFERRQSLHTAAKMPEKDSGKKLNMQRNLVRSSPKADNDIASAPLHETNSASSPTKPNPFMRPQKTPPQLNRRHSLHPAAKAPGNDDRNNSNMRRKSLSGPLGSKTNSVTPKNKTANNDRRKIAQPPPPPPPKQLAYDSGSGSDLESYAKVHSSQPNGDELMLNICTTSAPVARPKAKLKMSKAERMGQKRAQRQGTDLLGKRTLTQQEIDNGIRRFSENPNKKPRAADLFEQQEKQEKLMLQASGDATAAAEQPTKEPTELGTVDPNARKANAFRVRRPEDSTVKKINLFKNNPEAKLMGQRLVKPITERIFDGTKVQTLGLHAHAVKNLEDLLSISELTTVQQKTIPRALEGKDILVRSQTGSGKTLAYALPVVEKLQEIRPKLTRDDGILAVVIVPTRELAIQTYELFQKLLKPFTWIVPGVLMGGERRKAEKARLRKGINILVGTPGRLVDHLLHTESFKLSKSKFLVLDEADRLLEMGYERDVKQIVEAIDKQRAQLDEDSKTTAPHLQRLLLSATLTAAVQKLAGLTLHEPIFIDNSDEASAKALVNGNAAGGGGYTKEAIEAITADVLDQEDDTGILTIPENLQLSYVVVPAKLRLVTLSALLAKEFIGKQKLKAMIFMSTMEMVNFHHDLLNEQLTQKVLDEDDDEAANEQSDNEGEQPLLKGLRFFKLHGSMTQTERQGVFKSFRDCKSGVLLATDVVGRGIDVPEVDLVVQYSPPQKTADFVHRVGRTARAGRSGRAVLFLAPSEAEFVRFLEDKRIRISQVDMDIYLKALNDADNDANTIQEAASNLQHKFQELIADDKEMHEKACKAFVSWMKFYSTFPKELKSVFNIKNAHSGHFAKSFGLKDQPTSFTKKHSMPKAAPPTNRLTYTERDPEKLKLEKKAKKGRFSTTVTGEVRNANHRPASMPNRLHKMLPNSRALNTSEFDSGLPALKKRKT